MRLPPRSTFPKRKKRRAFPWSFIQWRVKGDKCKVCGLALEREKRMCRYCTPNGAEGMEGP